MSVSPSPARARAVPAVRAATLLAGAALCTLAARPARAQSTPPALGTSVSARFEVEPSWTPLQCGSRTTFAATSYGFDCSVANYGFYQATAQASSATSGRVGAATSLKARGVSPDAYYGASTLATVSATGGYTGRVTVSAPGGLEIAGIRFGMRLHGKLKASGTLRASGSGQCFWAGDAMAGAALTFASYGSQGTETPPGNTVGLRPIDRQVGCGSTADALEYNEYLRFLMPLGDGGNGVFHYELTSYSQVGSTYFANLLKDGLSADLTSDFIHTAGIETLEAVDASGTVVQGATFAFDDPSIVIAPLYPSTTTAPEPATFALVGGGVALLALGGRRRRRA